MKGIDGINIAREKEQLTIRIEPVKQEMAPTVTILNHSGEVLKKLRLEFEIVLDLSDYDGLDCSLRITNGKNVIVQKI